MNVDRTKIWQSMKLIIFFINHPACSSENAPDRMLVIFPSTLLSLIDEPARLLNGGRFCRQVRLLWSGLFHRK